MAFINMVHCFSLDILLEVLADNYILITRLHMNGIMSVILGEIMSLFTFNFPAFKFAGINLHLIINLMVYKSQQFIS